MLRRIQYTRLLFLIMLTVSVVYAGGCSRSVGSVSGKISYKGTPLLGGTVSLSNAQGTFGGTIKEDGTYIVPEVPAGEYKVVVETESIRPATMGTMAGGPKMGGSGKMAGMPQQKEHIPAAKELDEATKSKVPEGYKASSPADMAKRNARYVEIPAQYGKADTTTETYTVVSGDQTHDIDLK